MAQVLLAGEAGVNDVNRASQPPAHQVTLDLADDGLVVGVARPDPYPDRDTLAGDGQADHDLRQVGTVILGVPLAAQRPVGLTRARLLVLLLLVWVLSRLGLPVGRGGVEEDHIDLEVQQMRDAEEHRLLHALRALQQEVHRTVELIVTDALHTLDENVTPDPARRLQLRRRLKTALADHREDRALHPRAPAPSAGDTVDRLADPERRPQLPDDVRATRLRRGEELEAVRRARAQPVLTTEETLDRAH